MCKASDPVDFWGASVLFLKVVDGRYDLWSAEYEEKQPVMERFWPNLCSALRSRIGKWNSVRAGKLFGADAPKEVFLSHDRRTVHDGIGIGLVAKGI